MGVKSGISLMLGESFRQAAEPLFAQHAVEALEWSFDTCWDQPLPGWAEEWVRQIETRGNLLGHGVSLSLLSGLWSGHQEEWLERFSRECQRRKYHHISEHFGFCQTEDFGANAPLSVPWAPEIVVEGRSRLNRLRQISGLPVGLENLAFAFGPQDMWDQGPFMKELLEPHGFMVLDLHNIYCQSMNFNAPVEDILNRYPLGRVTEIHLSGGSWWSPAPGHPPLRRDTHDGAVPEELFSLLSLALSRCPSVEWAILEQLDQSLSTPSARNRFREDFFKLKRLIGSVS